MYKEATENIIVKARPTYQEKYSKPLNNVYLFSYEIEIHNQGDFAIQLLSRHWFIFDSNGEYSEVKGEGVIGEQPIIHPQQFHRYDSFSQLKTDMGMMWGTYLMKKMDDNKLFEVKIPEFHLIEPSRLN